MTHRDYTQLYADVMVTPSVEDEVDDGSPEDSKPRRSKRKGSGKAEDDSKKARQRGRPRLDTRDQTAAERRRTQIRLAQRAYRERKETTISALEKRVAKLKSITEEMEKTFLIFNNKATAAGLFGWASPLGQDMKKTMERIIELSQAASPDSDAEDDEQGAPKYSQDLSDHELQKKSSVTSLNHLSQVPAPPTSPSDMLGYQISYENEIDQLLLGDLQGYNATGGSDVQCEDTSTGHPEHDEILKATESSVELSPKIGMSLSTPYTFSFQETTFARRLLRASLEKAYHLLTDPRANPEVIHKVFRFSFCYSRSKTVTDQLRARLMRTKNESLEYWEAPRWHLGGAGLHYSRAPLDGNSQPPARWWAAQPMGPSRPFDDVETPAAAARDPELLAKLTNADGMWLDPSDVEHYLRTKGLFLDGHSSVAEIEVDVQPPLWMGEAQVASPSSSSSESFQGPISPPDISSTPPKLTMPSNDYFFEELNPSFPSFDLPSAESLRMDMDITGGWPENGIGLKTVDTIGSGQQNIFIATPTFAPPSMKRKINIDVDKLVETLNLRGICIGRSPGWRQDEVDTALNAVLQEAF